MEMIIGGAFQGKETYVRENYPGIKWMNGADITETELFQAQGVLGFHEYIKKEMRNKKDVQNLAEKLIKNNPGIIIVSDEVGYGVVPVDVFDRAYREAAGRVCTRLASFSTKVVRVICGIGMVIKSA